MLISVALCTYNGGAFLAGQLESIGRQTLLPDELVACDDRSTDHTLEILERFAASAPFSVRIFRNGSQLGSGKNFSQAIALCRGDLIALCDQDDLWSESKLQELSAVFSNPSVGGVFSNGKLIGHDSKELGATLWEAFDFTQELQRRWRTEGSISILLKRDTVTGATFMFRAQLRDLILPIPPSWLHDGWIAWITGLASRIEFLDSPLIKYRVHGSQQIGVPDATLTIGARFARASRTRAAEALKQLRKFEDLGERLTEKKDLFPVAHLMAVEQKIAFCRARNSLPKSRILRLPQVLLRLPSYMTYARGLREALKDATC
jgi:glycosyltransferase involved in cell wall biosynthesis